MNRTRRETLKLTGVAGGLLIFGSQTAAATTCNDEASVRVAHLSPDAPNVDVYVDDDEVLSDVPFGAISDYLELETGTYTFTITAAGDPETVAFEGDVDLEAQYYTVAAIGELGQETFEPLVLEDLEEAADPDEAQVRLVHASPDAPAVDVTVADEGITAFDDVAFGEDTEYVSLPPGHYTLEVRGATEDDTGDVVATFDVELEADTVYTAFAAGYLDPDEAAENVPFDLIVTLDGAAAMEAPVDEEDVDDDEHVDDDDDERRDDDDEHVDDDDDERRDDDDEHVDDDDDDDDY